MQNLTEKEATKKGMIQLYLYEFEGYKMRRLKIPYKAWLTIQAEQIESSGRQTAFVRNKENKISLFVELPEGIKAW